jgi:OOP family OmpA-OmpF porin
MLLLTQNVLTQQIQSQHINPLSDKIALNFEGGATYPRTDFSDDKISYIGQFAIDYFFPTSNLSVFGLRAYGYYGELKGSGTYNNVSTWPTIPEYRTEIASGGAGLTFTINASKVFYPYVFAGGGYLFFNPQDIDGNKLPRNSAKEYSRNSWTIIGELGSRFFVSDEVSLNLAVNMDYVPMDNLDDIDNTVTNGSDKDVFFTARAGIAFYFGGIQDSDGDGVRDENDMCLDTPPGVKVDQFGCAVDTDKDGVPDYLDKCSNTPKNISVDLDGCPLDVDGDGVPDYMDLCNDTPIGVAVDSRGCPSDSDDDGVPDFKDLCANTPVGTEVNKWGCPIDEEVFEPITKTEFVLSGGINFESGKSDLLPSAYPELDKVLKVMKDYPETKWKIEGHTDNTGSQKLNKDLSINRAQSVYNYFTRNGIAPARLSYNGYGPDYPIGDNSTETGKALNRRVAIVLVSDNETEAKNITAPNTERIYNVTAERNVGQMIFTDGYLYCVQVSSWRARAKAESEAMRLESEGYNSFIVIADLPELDGTWYRVRVGYYNTFDEANRVRERVK